jgi:hypothetical protein
MLVEFVDERVGVVWTKADPICAETEPTSAPFEGKMWMRNNDRIISPKIAFLCVSI